MNCIFDCTLKNPADSFTDISFITVVCRFLGHMGFFGCKTISVHWDRLVARLGGGTIFSFFNTAMAIRNRA